MNKNEEQTNANPISDSIPNKGRIVGVDFGTRRIGVAISDPSQTVATPLATLQSQNRNADGKWFLKLADDEQAVGWVIGLPVHMSGDPSGKSREATAFGTWLGKLTNLPVAWQDERYSSARAKEICFQLGLRGDKRKAHLDKIAAQVILASWLERTVDDAATEGLED